METGELAGAFQFNSTLCDTPVPVSVTTSTGSFDDELLMVSCPCTVPVAVGSNSTLSVVDCCESSVRGSVGPSTLNPLPASVTALMVTGEVPVDLSVRDWVAGEFTTTSPNAMAVALNVSAGPLAGVSPPEGFNSMSNVAE